MCDTALSLEKSYLPDFGSLQNISIRCFNNCSNLYEINFHSSLKYIDKYAFQRCSKIVVDFPSSSQLEIIGAHAFIHTKIKYFRVPKSVKIIQETPFIFNMKLVNFSFEEGNPNFYIENNLYYNPTKDFLLGSFPNLCGEIVLNSTIKEIQYEAFRGSHITSLVINEGCTKISAYLTTDNPNLVKVVIPSTVSNLPLYTFDDSPNLKILIINGDPTFNTYSFRGFKMPCGLSCSDKTYNELRRIGIQVSRDECDLNSFETPDCPIYYHPCATPFCNNYALLDKNVLLMVIVLIFD